MEEMKIHGFTGINGVPWIEISLPHYNQTLMFVLDSLDTVTIITNWMT